MNESKIFQDTDNEDVDIEQIAIKRLENCENEKNFVSFENVLNQFHLTKKELDEIGEIEFE